VIDRAAYTAWIEGYERAWRSPGTGGLAELFTEDATYLHSPYADPVIGLDAIRADWEANRDGPDEEFTMAAVILAIEGETGVARVFVRYAANHQEYLDLWVARFGPDGRCKWFEEWPFWPGQAWSASDRAPAG